MSSHHFVKEEQEPALLVLDCSNAGFEEIGPLLEWVPTVLVAQEEVFALMAWGIKIDLILADLDFQKQHYHLLEEQYPVKFLGIDQGNYLQEGLHYLMATKHKAVNVIGWPLERTNEIESFLEVLDIVIWDGGFRYFPVKSGEFKKWVPNSELILFANQPMAVEVDQGSKSSYHLKQDKQILSTTEGLIQLKGEGIFWIGEQIKN